MKKALILMMLIFVSTIALKTQIEPPINNGWYEISTLDHLRWISENPVSWDKNFKLMNDIDASDTKNWNVGNHDENSNTPDSAMGWSPIGTKTTPFIGQLDGQNHYIGNLYINRPAQVIVGFIGYSNNINSIISNITISNCHIRGNNSVGALVGSSYYLIIFNSSSSGSINCIGGNSGGLVGYPIFGSITNSNSSVNITGDNTIGGLVGGNICTILCNSYSTGDVKGNKTVGGLSGENHYTTIQNCFASGSISGISSVGGLVGYNNSAVINNSYSTGRVLGKALIGGLVGNNRGHVYNSFWDTESSGLDSSAAGEGKSSEEMKNLSTFTDAGWNFKHVWEIKDSYPYFKVKTNLLMDIDGNGFIDINSLEDLQYISESCDFFNTKLELKNNINAADTKNWNQGLGFSPIIDFSGVFEGNGFAIDSLYVHRLKQEHIGLFGSMHGKFAEIRNLGVRNCNIEGATGTGSIVGHVVGGNLINSYSTGVISEKGESSGGLVGQLTYGYIFKCYTNITLNGSGAGIAGSCYKSTISNCYARGNIVSTYGNSGFATSNYQGKIINCYSTCDLKSNLENEAGFIGKCNNDTIISCFWDIESSGKDSSAGGIGKTTAEMKTKSTFTDAGWDFVNIWQIIPEYNYGYPCFIDKYLAVDDEMPFKFDLNIYPNPTNDYLNIGAIPYLDKEPEIRIFNNFGECVMTIEYKILLTQQRIDISTLSNGVYFLKIGDVISKFIITR